MTDEDTFPSADTWGDEEDIEQRTEEDVSDFSDRVEEIRERRADEREQETDEESLDEAVERLSGRVYRVRYTDPANPEDRNTKTLIADTVNATAAGMAFSKDGGDRVRVYPAPVDIDRLDDDDVRSWARRRREGISGMIARIFGDSGGS